MNKPKPYDLNLVKITNHAKVLAIQERKFHKHQKTKTMSKEYIGSQEAFEDSIKIVKT